MIRPLVAGDCARVREVLLAAFPTSAEADLVEQLRVAGDSAMELVAQEQGGVIGHILFSKMEAPFRALALAPVAVTPARQNAGIGSALIHAGHEHARDQGWQAIFVLGEPAYYTRFGYSTEAARPFDNVYTGPYFMMLPLVDELPAASGEVRHAAAFAALG